MISTNLSKIYVDRNINKIVIQSTPLAPSLTLTVEQKFRRFLPANILWSPRLPIQPWNSVDNFLHGNRAF